MSGLSYMLGRPAEPVPAWAVIQGLSVLGFGRSRLQAVLAKMRDLPGYARASVEHHEQNAATFAGRPMETGPGALVLLANIDDPLPEGLAPPYIMVDEKLLSEHANSLRWMREQGLIGVGLKDYG